MSVDESKAAHPNARYPNARYLRDIAHARAGDKGNRSNVSVFVYDPVDYEQLLRLLTPERLRERFGGLLRGEIVIYPLPALSGLNLVFDNALEGGVNESLNLDGHGKSWSAMVLGLPLEPMD